SRSVFAMVTAPVVVRTRMIDGPQIQTGHPGRNVKAYLALCADGLQRERVVRAAQQCVGTYADADRGIALNAAVAAGEVARVDCAGRREHAPPQRYVFRPAKIDAIGVDAADIRVCGAADGGDEHALQVQSRTDDESDPAGAVAGETAGFDVGLDAG